VIDITMLSNLRLYTVGGEGVGGFSECDGRCEVQLLFRLQVQISALCCCYSVPLLKTKQSVEFGDSISSV
jgi:hypothetical protein